jgi:hypothetical protein
MTTYNYDNIPTIFINGVNLTQLYQILRRTFNKFQNINISGDNMKINTTSELTNDEMTTMNNIFNTHIPIHINDISNDILEPNIIYPKINSYGYTRIATSRFPGSREQFIDKMIIKAYVDKGRSYNIRLQNYDNGEIIYESENLMNTTLQTIEITSNNFTNIPITDCYVNILAKLNGDSYEKHVYIEYVAIYIST